MVTFRRRNHMRDPAPHDQTDLADPTDNSDPSDSPANTFWGVLGQAIRNNGQTIRLAFIAIVIFGGIAIVVEAAKGIHMPAHLHWLNPVMVVANALGGSAVTVTVILIRNVRRGRFDDGERLAKAHSSHENRKSTPRQRRLRRLPCTTPRSLPPPLLSG
jgi:hypothetical protein